MIGKPLPRIDGPAKVTGRAQYSYERNDFGKAAVGLMLGATIAKGRIAHINTTAAERAPGVLLVITHRNVAAQGKRDGSIPEMFARPWPVLEGPTVAFFGQPVALVVAETFEEARSAAMLIDVDYFRADGAFDLAAAASRAYAPKTANAGQETEVSVGDLDRAMASAPVKVDQTYTTAASFAQPMEPQACLARWDDDDLHLCLAVQGIAAARTAVARTLMMPVERVHLDAAYVGGGFGSKLRTHEETAFAALAARRLGRPVRVMPTRRQIFTIAGRRPETIQRVRLAATRDGRLQGVGHDVTMQNAKREEFAEQTATVLRSLYAAPNRLTRHRLVDLDVNFGQPVRGPGELPGLLAVESAIDELAHDLGMDPIELRVINEPTLDPEKNLPFSGRRLVECMRDGARRFGWADRSAQPGTRRNGEELIGIGMAAAIRMHFQGATQAAVRMAADGRVTVRSDMTDIGTGTYTILAQVAAEGLDVPMDRITVELARTDLPVSAGSGGSWGAPNTANAVYRACGALRAKVFGADAKVDGRRLAAEVARRFPDGVEAEGAIAGMADDPGFKTHSHHTYGATFAEVGVNAVTGEIRLRRMLGVFSAGRIINPQTARSQLIGGMIWGLSAALYEGADVDPRHGNVVNGDLADYVVPVHADVPDIDAILLGTPDTEANPLGIKGVGELGVCGSGTAVANAVFNATGVRVRHFPIRNDDLFAALPAIGGQAVAADQSARQTASARG